ncbi:MAG: hypothetical protein V3V15_08845 [Sphingorhabdus sp.]
MNAAPRHLTYSFDRRDEQLLAFGPADAAQRILIIAPLFDEMNRMRRTLVEAMRLLDGAGIASALPDLPGCNESLALLEEQSLDKWRAAAKAAAGAFAATHILSIRGGALIDDGAADLPHLRLSPVKGRSLLNMLIRTRIAGDKEAGLTTSAESLADAAMAGPIELAGNRIGPEMSAQLTNAEPADLANYRDIKPADISGQTLWLRAEPQHDAAMAAGLAEELARWSGAA